MARKPKQIRTIHHLAIAASMKEQSDAVMKLITTVNSVASTFGDQLPKQIVAQLRDTATECQRAMWPSPEDGE